MEKEFYDEVRKQKNIAHSASKRVGLHKKCTLPTRTKQEIKAMTGPVTTYQLTQPWTWSEFTSAPQNIQLEYLKGLVERFGAGKVELATLWGASVKALDTYFQRQHLDRVFKSKCSEVSEDWEPFVSRLWSTTAVVSTDDDIANQTATAFKAYRDTHRLSRRMMAEALGITQSQVSYLESGRASFAKASAGMNLLQSLGTDRHKCVICSHPIDDSNPTTEKFSATEVESLLHSILTKVREEKSIKITITIEP